jgi:hypothetical protein
MKNCPYCKQDAPEDAVSCPHCGGDLLATPSSSQEPALPPTPPSGASARSRNKPNILATRLPVLAIGLGVAMCQLLRGDMVSGVAIAVVSLAIFGVAVLVGELTRPS